MSFENGKSTIKSEDTINDGYSVCSALPEASSTSVSPKTKSPKKPSSPVEPKSPKIKSPETFLSPLEELILRSKVPIEIDEAEEITVLGERGIWANKMESTNWKGDYKLKDYPLNEDTSPEIITKKLNHELEYIQEFAYRYLKPPTPPLPGEIIIRHEANKVTPPAPPLIIRQQPPRPATPEPIVIREAPPQPPPPVGRKIITISGSQLPPPPRKVVIERLAPIPSKPQAIIVERWLPFSKPKRKVIYQQVAQQDPVFVKPKNVIVQWEPPSVVIKKEVKHLGVIKADPQEYYNKYKSSLKHSSELPDFVKDIKPPEGIQLAADYSPITYELEGDIEALKLIDLDREGLGEYRALLNNYKKSKRSKKSSSDESTSDKSNTKSSSRKKSPNKSSNLSSSTITVIESIFNEVDVERDGEITVQEANDIFGRLNERMGRVYKPDELRRFLKSRNLDSRKNDTINLNDFKDAFEYFAYE